MKGWKREEQRIARLTGGQRVTTKGTEAPDVVSPLLVIEVKERAQLPQWMTIALDKLRRFAKAEQLPVVILHERGSHQRLAICRLEELLRWLHRDVVGDHNDG